MYQDISVVITTEINTEGYLLEILLTKSIINIAKRPINKVGVCVLTKDSDITIIIVW